ncbi:hypothetical protein ACJX0J_012292, partial [Zea mays]
MKVQERILNLVGGFKLKNMGQKINPLGFRLGTTQNHHSFWFAQPKNYSEGLQEDKKIRNCIKNYIQKNRKKGSNRKMESKKRGSRTKCDVLFQESPTKNAHYSLFSIESIDQLTFIVQI